MDKINFQNGASGNTPLNATNLNKMQDNVENAITEESSLLNEKIVGTVLFENTDGEIGDITLSETSANFKCIEVYYGRHSTPIIYDSLKIYSPNGKRIVLSLNFSASIENFQIYSKTLDIAEQTITKISEIRALLAPAPSIVLTNTENIRIYKVIGYK